MRGACPCAFGDLGQEPHLAGNLEVREPLGREFADLFLREAGTLSKHDRGGHILAELFMRICKRD